MPFGRRRNRIDRSLRERGVPPEPQHREREVVETSGPWDEADAPDDGIAPGTRWADVPMNWTCPECGARKDDFEMVEI